MIKSCLPILPGILIQYIWTQLLRERPQAGAVVVHGIHAILWALDKLVELGAVTEEIVSLKVQFRNFIPVGKQVELKLLSRDAKSVRLELCLGKLTTVTLVVTFGTRKGTSRC